MCLWQKINKVNAPLKTVVILLVASICFGQQRGIVLEPGGYVGQEMKNRPRDGQLWMGLCPKDGAYQWIKAPVHVLHAHDSNDIDGVDTHISFAGCAQPVLLQKGLNVPVMRPIVTTLSKADGSLQIGAPLQLKFESHIYTLKIVSPQSDGIAAGSQLVFDDGEHQQVLFTCAANCNSPSWELLWAGDADFDGKLDLYINASNHYAAGNHMLLLSSLKNGTLLGKFGAVTFPVS